MAFKFKTKKRPTAAQAFAGGFAQGAIKGLQEGAERSLQDRLNQQEAFKDFRKDFSQSINYIDVSDEDRKILRDTQSMMLMGTLKNKDEVVTHLNAKSPNLGFKITGAQPPEFIKTGMGGLTSVIMQEGTAIPTEIIPSRKPRQIQKAVFNKTTGQEQFATDEEIASDPNLVPVKRKTAAEEFYDLLGMEEENKYESFRTDK